MKLRLLLVGRTERGPVGDALQHYVDRLGRMATLEVVVVPESTAGDPAFRQRSECERLLAAIREGEKVVALAERGQQLTSVAFAQRVGTWRDQGTRQLVFIVGGAYGLDDALRKRADLVLALSAMTFPHQLVRVLFAEQLYRAYAILNRLPYHH